MRILTWHYALNVEFGGEDPLSGPHLVPVHIAARQVPEVGIPTSHLPTVGLHRSSGDYILVWKPHSPQPLKIFIPFTKVNFVNIYSKWALFVFIFVSIAHILFSLPPVSVYISYLSVFLCVSPFHIFSLWRQLIFLSPRGGGWPGGGGVIPIYIYNFP